MHYSLLQGEVKVLILFTRSVWIWKISITQQIWFSWRLGGCLYFVSPISQLLEIGLHFKILQTEKLVERLSVQNIFPPKWRHTKMNCRSFKTRFQLPHFSREWWWREKHGVRSCYWGQTGCVWNLCDCQN